MFDKFSLIKDCAMLSHQIYEDKIDKTNIIFSKEISNVLVQIIEAENKIIKIVVRGSDNKPNWIDNLKFWKSYDKTLGIYLHNGFKNTNDKIFIEIFKFLKENNYLDYKYILTGHSLGSVNALLLALKLDSFGFDIEQYIGFGTPKITNLKGAMKISFFKLIREHKILRIINDKDIVNLLFYSSLLIKLNYGEYRHAGTEIILADDGKISVNNWDKVLTKNKTLLKNIDIHSIKEHKMENYIKKIDKILLLNKVEIINHTFNI